MAAPTSDLIVIGGSAGALDALAAILPALAPEYHAPIVLVLHVAPERPSRLVDVIGPRCALGVREAEDKEPLAPATLYIAPPDYHLMVERQGCLSLSVDEPVHFSRPAIDVLFESAAEAFGSRVLAVLLSGASEDGVRGLSKIHDGGGTTVIQSPETAAARTMPEAALRKVAVDWVLSPNEIGVLLAGLSVEGRVGREAT